MHLLTQRASRELSETSNSFSSLGLTGRLQAAALSMKPDLFYREDHYPHAVRANRTQRCLLFLGQELQSPRVLQRLQAHGAPGSPTAVSPAVS